MKTLKIILLFMTICFWNCSVVKEYESAYHFLIINNTTSEIILEYRSDRSTSLMKDEFKTFYRKYDFDHEMSQAELDSIIGYIKVYNIDSLKYVQEPINLDLWELDAERKDDSYFSASHSIYKFLITDSLLTFTD